MAKTAALEAEVATLRKAGAGARATFDAGRVDICAGTFEMGCSPVVRSCGDTLLVTT